MTDDFKMTHEYELKMFNINNAAPTNMCICVVLVLDLLSSISSWPSNLSTTDQLTARLLPGLWYSLYLHCIFITLSY